MTSWLERLGTWKEQQDGRPALEFYTILERDKNSLVISLGDSWTWGDSLDPKTREQEIYGRLLADYYDADFINVGCLGWSNSWVLHTAKFILSELKKNNKYEKVYVIVTLTETARDLTSFKSFDFHLQRDRTRPFLQEDYQKILDEIEQHWMSQLISLLELADDRFTFFVGQNFVWHPMYDSLKSMPIVITDVNWVEVMADYQNLPRPVRTNFGTGWIFDIFSEVNQILEINDTTVYKNFIMPLIDKANDLNKWLDISQLNSKKASKHPTKKGHELWAAHIIEKISLYNKDQVL
jgi:hypothetical protein